jgi:hypothetical protein
MVGEVEIHPTRYSCVVDEGQSTYPLLGYIDLIEYKDNIENHIVKCTRNAAASIALVSAETPYAHTSSILNRLMGIDINAMSVFRITDSVGSEFVEEPVSVDEKKKEEITVKLTKNPLHERINQLNNNKDRDKIIKKALLAGPGGVLRKNYIGATKKIMYILADGTGVPGRRKELLGVHGKQSDGSAKTFEAKIGAVYTVEYTSDFKPLLSDNGEIYRDKNVKYMGTVRKVEDFGPMLYQHAMNNGLSEVDAVIFLGDGARWLWKIHEKYFPFAITGIDLYHAIERVSLLTDYIQFKGRSGKDSKNKFEYECIELLKQGKTQDMLELIESMPCKTNHEKKLQSALEYFQSNMDKMNYGIFTALGLFVGSGIVEAGCKVIVGTRMKNAGMHWSKTNAEKIIALRCAIRNNEFLDEYLQDQELLNILVA